MDYYNDTNENCIKALKELIHSGMLPRGDVDGRPIEEVRGNELKGYLQCHFFAGVGGWPLAAKLAGWPPSEPLWTGSCPCQPFSNAHAGSSVGFSDPRHLWPFWRKLILKRQPASIVGEQVATKAAKEWFCKVRTDMEALGYAVGGANLCAPGIGAPHIRQRIFWVAHSIGTGLQRDYEAFDLRKEAYVISERQSPWNSPGSPFADWEKLMAQPNASRMADGVSSLVDVRPRLHAYGNAIVPQLGAEFLKAYMEILYAQI